MASSSSEDGLLARNAAHLRVNRIAQFHEELGVLEQEQALLLTPEQRVRLEAHLERLTSDLVLKHGIDTTESARRMSWGMRLTALLGGVAVFAALVLLLHRVWGLLPSSAQVILLTILPLAFLAGAAWSNRRGLDPFFTMLLALAAGVAFVMDLSSMVTIFNQLGSPHGMLAWAIMALCMGYGLNTRLLLAAGLILICAYASALGQMLSGGWWASWFERPVFMIPAAAIVYAIPGLIKRPDPHRFAVVFRACGAGVGLFALLFLSLMGHLCCHGVSMRVVETLAQLAGMGLSAVIVYHGLRLGEGSLANIGAIAFVTFLFAQLHAWCWDWMPKYAFCFMLGLIAIVLLVVFRRLRLGTIERRVT